MSEGSELNQYQVVSSFEGGLNKSYRMEDGKKWRQFLAAVLCKWTLDGNFLKILEKQNGKTKKLHKNLETRSAQQKVIFFVIFVIAAKLKKRGGVKRHSSR